MAKKVGEMTVELRIGPELAAVLDEVRLLHDGADAVMDRLARIAQLHRESGRRGICAECDRCWPCPTHQLAAGE